MKLQKHEREALRAVQAICPNMDVNLQPAGRHPRLTARYADRTVHVSVASSPSCADAVAMHTVQLVRRRFRGLGIELPDRASQCRRRLRGDCQVFKVDAD